MLEHSRRLIPFTLALLALTLTDPALAMGGLVLMDPPPEDGLKMAAGVSMWSLRGMPGDHPRQRNWLYPALELRSPSGWFASTDLGLGWNFSHDPAVQAGLRLAPWPGRTPSDPSQRFGTRLEQSAFYNHALGEVALLQTSLSHGGGRNRNGWIGELGLTSGIPLPNKELLGVSVGAGFANGAYRSNYAGGQTGLPASMPGGWHDLQFGLSYEHRLDERWRLDGQWLSARAIGPRQSYASSLKANQRSLSLSLWRDLD